MRHGSAGGAMLERRTMEGGDWFSAAVNVLIGAFLGSAAYSLLQLVLSGAWLMAAVLVVLGVGVFGFVLLLDKLSDLIFPSAIRSYGKNRHLGKPWALVLSLPLGLGVGVVLGMLGLDRVILDWL